MNLELPIDEHLCNLARDYVLKEYAPAGQISYAWEEQADPLDDTTVRVLVGECPPDDVNYEWMQVCSCEVTSSKVSQRDDLAQEYTVTITAQIAIARGNDDDEEDLDEVKPEETEIYCYIQHSKYDGFYVADAEE